MKQILIVEDDSFLNKMLAYNLTADGYGVTSDVYKRQGLTPSTCDPRKEERYGIYNQAKEKLFRCLQL